MADSRDPAVNSNKDRSEVYANQTQAGASPGQEWWYNWWTYFPGPTQSWWNRGGDWNDITQINEVGGARWIMVGVDATKNQTPNPNLWLSYSTGKKIIEPSLKYDHWYHFLLHIKWATNSTGFLEAYLDGQQVLSLTNGATMPADNPTAVWTQGIYRGAWPATNTVIHDGACRAATRAAAEAC